MKWSGENKGESVGYRKISTRGKRDFPPRPIFGPKGRGGEGTQFGSLEGELSQIWTDAESNEVSRIEGIVPKNVILSEL